MDSSPMLIDLMEDCYTVYHYSMKTGKKRILGVTNHKKEAQAIKQESKLRFPTGQIKIKASLTLP